MRTRHADEPARGITLLWFGAAVLAALVLMGCGSVQQPGEATTALAGAMASGATASGVPVPGRPVPASALRTLRAIVARVAKVNGDKAPVWVSVVVTTHEKALTSATPGDTESAGQKTIVYLVTMKGHFVANDVPTPSGAHAPTGTYLSIVLNAKTFESLDFGLSPKPPPVAPATLGPVTHLTAAS